MREVKGRARRRKESVRAAKERVKDARKQAGSNESRSETYEIKDLAQLRVLADPLRVRILEALCEERTTKQVADLLGEPPTRLYHHVEKLHGVGLIEQTRTNQKRGTIEKYYRAVAVAFRADASLLQSAPEGKKDDVDAMVATVFGNTAAELQRLAAARRGAARDEHGADEALMAYTELRTSAAGIEAIRAKLKETLEGLPDAPDGERRYRLTLALFPLDRFED